MSKHKDAKPALADWEVTLDRPLGAADDFPGTRVIRAASWKRGKRGRYTFTDGQGVVAEYAAGGVHSVTRLDPPVVVHPPAGPEILPVTPHGGK